MAVSVVDASALAALLYGEPEGPHVAANLSGSSMAAPALLAFEMANVCLMKCRRHPQLRNALVAAFAKLPSMNIMIVDVDHDEALVMGETAGVTAYDASYLWLAESLDADLVTLDRALATAHQSLKHRRSRKP